MTDRLKGFVVVLEEDLREDDAEATLAAIRQLKRVVAVTPVKARMEDTFAEERVRHDLRQKMFDVLFPERPKR